MRKTAQVAEESKIKIVKEKLTELNNSSVTITVKSDDLGNLYKKINATDIANAIKTEHEIEIDETAILLETPIHNTGDTEVSIEVADDKITLTVKVVTEEGEK